LTSSDGLLTIPETRQYKTIYQDDRGIVYLEVIEDALFLHSLLFDLKDLRQYKAFIHLLSIELLEKGQQFLFCFIETPVEKRFAEFFGFTETSFKTNHNGGQTIMMKDLKQNG